MKKYLLPLLLVVSAPFHADGQVPSYVPTANLEGWWPFTGNANDLSVHGRNGLVSGSTLTVDRMGNANSAYAFNGTSNSITVSNVMLNNLVHSTVSAWLKPTGNADATRYYDTYFGYGSYPGTTLACAYEYGIKRFNLYGGCQGTSQIPEDITNQWHHVVITHDSLINRIYVDGAVTDTFTSAAPVCINNNDKIVFGGEPVDFQWFTGTLDDIGFWSRTLSGCEILDLYHAAVLSFTTQPVSKSAAPGNTVSFTVNAGPTATTYQWQSNTGSGGAFVNLSNTGQYSGVNTNTLTVSSLTAANNNQHFRCIAGNAGNCNMLTSNEATLTVIKTGIDDLYANTVLEQNIPNPASSQTTIRYYIPSFRDGARLIVCDAGGRVVSQMKINVPGKGQATFSQLGQGIYFYSLFIDGQKVRTQKMTILN